MPLRKALIEAPLDSGLNQKVDRRDLQVDGAVVMTNCVRGKNGSIQKRPGSMQLSNTLTGRTSLAPPFSISEFAAVRGANYGHAPLLFDGFTFSEYSDIEGSWTLVDSTPEAVALDRLPIYAQTQANVAVGADVDFCAALNVYVCTYSATGYGGALAAMVTVIDASNGATIVPAFQVSNTTTNPVLFPKVVVCGTIAVIGYIQNVAGTPNVNLATYNLSTLSPSTGVVFDSVAFDIQCPFDIMPVVGDPTRFFLAYFKGSNAVTWTVNPTTLTGIHNSVFAVANTGEKMACWAKSGEEFWIGYSSKVGGTWTVYAAGYLDSGGFTQTSTLTLNTSTAGAGNIGIARVSATDSVVFYGLVDQNGSGAVPSLVSTYGAQVTSGGGGAVVGAQRRTPGVLPSSKPAVLVTAVGTRCYMLVNTPSYLQGTQALVCFDWFGSGAGNVTTGGSPNAPARLVTTISPRLSKVFGPAGLGPGTYIAEPLAPAKLVATNTATTLVTISYVNNSLLSASIYIQPFDFASQQRFFGGCLNGNAMLGVSAGAPLTFDGVSPAEMGFLWYPEAIFTSLSAGSLTGAYSYIITYEWPDADGSIHRSATSPPINVTLSSQETTLTLPTLGVTYRQRPTSANVLGNLLFQQLSQNVSIRVYRTAASGTVYYYVGSVDNSTASSSVTFVDNVSDATISGQGAVLLYTTGGVLDNFCPPGVRVGITHKNRFWLAGADDPTVLWPSKALTTGEVPGFNEQFNIVCSGAVRALASLDEKLIIFVQRGTGAYGIEYLIGDGPFDTGASDDWTDPPQPIPSGAGAVDQRAIAVCELGVFFFSICGGPQGQGGIFLLTRDLQVHYLSGPVEDTVAANPVCTSVVVHPNAGRVYFEMSSSDTIGSTTGGARLVYDYIQSCWSTDTHYSFDASRDLAAARTTWVAGGNGWNGRATVNMPLVYWADYSGRTYRESSGVPTANSHIDNSVSSGVHWVTATFTSAWFKPALSGFSRMWRAQIESDVLDPASLTVTFAFDYAPTSYYSESMSFTDTAIASFDRAPQCDVEHLVGNQKCKAIQVTLQDSLGSAFTTGRGFSWSTIALECGVADGERYQNLPSGQRG